MLRLVFLFGFLVSSIAVGLGVFLFGEATGAREETPLACVQRHLTKLGYYQGPIDGVLSPSVIEAARRMKRLYKAYLLPSVAELNDPAIWCQRIDRVEPYRVAAEAADRRARERKQQVDIYRQCVQRQLAELEYYPGKVTGKHDPELAGAMQAFREVHKTQRLPHENAHSFQEWCTAIGIVKPAMKRFWPTKDALQTKLTLKADDKTQTQKVAEQAYHDAREFFVHQYKVDIRTPVGISVAKDGDEAIRNLNQILKRQNASVNRFSQYWIDRCARGGPMRVDGMVYLHTVFLCGLTLTGAPSHDDRIKQSLQKTMVHEYVHLLQGELSKEGGVAKRTTTVSHKALGWLVEGSANYFTTRYLETIRARHVSEKGLRDWVNEHNPKRLEDLAGRSIVRAYQDYYLAELGITYLAKQKGEDALFEYFRLLGRGYASERAFKTAFGLTTREFYKQFENGFRAGL